MRLHVRVRIRVRVRERACVYVCVCVLALLGLERVTMIMRYKHFPRAFVRDDQSIFEKIKKIIRRRKRKEQKKMHEKKDDKGSLDFSYTRDKKAVFFSILPYLEFFFNIIFSFTRMNVFFYLVLT